MALSSGTLQARHASRAGAVDERIPKGSHRLAGSASHDPSAGEAKLL